MIELFNADTNFNTLRKKINLSNIIVMLYRIIM